MIFKKKSCGNCGKNLSKEYSYCPYCGEELKRKRREEDFGLLGKDDSFEQVDPFKEMGFGLPGGFNMILNSLLKNLEGSFKDFEKIERTERADNGDKLEKIESELKRNNPNVRQSGFSINISSSGGYPHKIKIQQLGDNDFNGIANKEYSIPKEKKSISLDNKSSERFKNFSKLPKEEPKVNIRRLGNKIIYEIELPEVKSLEDISLMNLESGIEIKAIADKKAYSKKISIKGLPLVNSKFSEGKLMLEFKTA